jgi:hypothetical protein
LAVIVASLIVAWGAHANSAGAPANAAVSGCTCHANQPSNDVEVSLGGLPEAYEAGTDYALTVMVDGPAPLPIGQNQGGFQVIVDRGTLMPTGQDAQALNESAVTHNSAGNDQRQWSLTWSAPTGSEASAPATFWVAGNAVNGDTTTQGDQWNRAVMQVPAAGANGTTPTGNQTEPADGGIPGPALAAVLASVGAVALWRTRRA